MHSKFEERKLSGAPFFTSKTFQRVSRKISCQTQHSTKEQVLLYSHNNAAKNCDRSCAHVFVVVFHSARPTTYGSYLARRAAHLTHTHTQTLALLPNRMKVLVRFFSRRATHIRRSGARTHARTQHKCKTLNLFMHYIMCAY